MGKTKQSQKVVSKAKEVSLTEQMKSLIKKEAEAWYDVAVTAYQIYRNEEWAKLGYASARDYVTAEFEHLGFSYSTFMYRVQMGRAIDTYDIRREHVSSLGWSKFREIASFVLAYELKADELEQIVEEAKDLSVRQLREKISKMKSDKRGGRKERSKVITFKLLESQAAVVAEALDIASQLAETDSPSVALVYICTNFLLHRSENSETVDEIRKRIVASYEENEENVEGEIDEQQEEEDDAGVETAELEVENVEEDQTEEISLEDLTEEDEDDEEEFELEIEEDDEE